MSTAPVTSDPTRSNEWALDDGTAPFAAVRGRLLAVAHRILGRWTDAEDVVQDTWMRWQLYDRTTVANPTAFLVTATRRLAINAAQSARARREACVGEWPPEPAAVTDDPARVAEHRDALEHGVTVLLERLAPSERAAYVLHEAFDYPYPQIAELLDTSEANARQLGSRARKHLVAARRKPASRDDHRRLARAILGATPAR